MDETTIVDIYVSCIRIGISKNMEQRVTSTKLREILSVKREKRAKSLASMGLVERIGDRFRVSTPGVHSRSLSYEVTRDETGQVRCTCLEFQEAGEDAGLVCEHILAVKFAIRLKNTEPGLKETASENKTKTESRGRSSRGEQKSDEVAANASGTGPAEVEEAADASLEPIGDKEMNKENSREMPLAAEIGGKSADESQNNILNFSSTLRELRKTLDPQLVKQREGWVDRNGHTQMVDYVEWHTVADILDQEAANWTHTVKDIRAIGEIVTVTVAITIDGITREGIGTGAAGTEMGIKKAEHDALKRAAVKFGIARDLYKKEFEAIERETPVAAQAESHGFPANPIARSLSDLVTARQLGMIRAIAREIGIDADQESNSVMRCRTDEMSKRAASSLIQHLQEMQKSKGAAVPQAA